MAGSQPCLAINGLMPVVLQGELRMKYRAMGTTEAQLPFFSTNLATIEFRVLWRRYTAPFPCRWYGEDLMCCMPFCSNHF